MKKIFGYIRRSIENDNLSLQAQEKSIRSFADSQSWTIVDIFCDHATSGKHTDRIGYQKMISSLTTNGRDAVVDLILVPKLDRMSRSLKDILILVEDKLEPLGVGLKSVTESFDTSTGQGKLMVSLLGSFSEFERSRILERFQSGRVQLAVNGGFTGGHIPYGYKKNPNGRGIVPDEYESKIVHQLFTLFTSKGLSPQNMKVATGCTLHRDSISELLSNPLYAGLVEYDGELSQGSHESLVSVRLFNKAQETKLLKARNPLSLFKLHGTSRIPLKLTES